MSENIEIISENSNVSKKLKLISDDVKNKDLTKTLIIKNSDRIKYITVNSESIGWKKFIQIKLDNQKTEFAKCFQNNQLWNKFFKCKIEISQPPLTNQLIKLSPTDAKTKIAKTSALFCSKDLRPFNFIDDEAKDLIYMEKQILKI
jgi:hypothetical protein